MTERLKKSLGQHFLVDTGVLGRIVAAIAPRPGQRLVEIGPGGGALTLPLLDASGQLTAIELDRDLHARLRQQATSHGCLDLIEGNVLQVDFTALAERLGGPLRLVGNLPYYLSSPILFHALAHADALTDMTFLLQKEVVDRAVAPPGSKVYGRLSVMLQLACRAESLLEVPPQAFAPPPKVDSALLRLVPRPAHERPAVAAGVLEAVVRDAFGQRRKTLRNALQQVCDADAIRAAGLRPEARAEQLEVAEFKQLANHLATVPPEGDAA